MSGTTGRWLTEDEVREIKYAQYWNDVEAEREKPWNVADGDFGKLERYLAETGLRDDPQAVGRPLGGAGIDLAAGTLWAAPLLLAAEAAGFAWRPMRRRRAHYQGFLLS